MYTQYNLYIVLSRSQTIISKIIHFVTNDRFTHSAIALDEDLDLMFSFGRRFDSNPFIGCFKRENLRSKMYRSSAGLPGMIIELNVTREQYEAVVHKIDYFRRCSGIFSYNVLGLVFNAFNTSRERALSFFCSEFVYYVLNEGGVCDFGVPRGDVRPMSLTKLDGRIVYEGDLLQYHRAQPAIVTA